MDAAALRAEFPVLERLAYLNAGTDGPIPAAAVAAAREELDAELAGGRFHTHFERRRALQTELRGAYATVLGCAPEDVALTTSTSDGIGRVLAGLDLGKGDEILTSDHEHPGLIGPLIAARLRGVAVRAVPMRELADAVRPSTTLVACSHVNWVTGETVPPALAQAGVPVVLDGAQGVGAVSVDVHALGCAAYAGSGQKWMCGADGTGMLYIAPEFRARVRVIAPSYMSLEDASKGMDASLRDSAAAYDTPSLSREAVAFSLAALRVLEAAGWESVYARAAAHAAQLAQRLADSGRVVSPRGETTLVSFQDADPPATRRRVFDAGVVVRDLPGTLFLRASVGAWNDMSDLDRLLAALT
jgi:selenocysteine lyase/cysteine desulfurase